MGYESAAEECKLNPLRVGVIGCGVISNRYLRNLRQLPNVFLAAVADQEVSRATTKGEVFGVPGMTVSALLADPTSALVVSLVPPLAYAEISRAAIRAGKHVYSDNPWR